MPIRPENRARYVPWWDQLAEWIEFTRADGRCEWCGAEHGKPHPITGSRVVLTTAQVHDHRPENCHPDNLAALGQLRHNRHDAAHRRATRARSTEGCCQASSTGGAMTGLRVLLTTLSVRTSAQGRQCLSGWLGKARVAGFSGEPDARGDPTWELYVAGPEPRDGPPRPAAKPSERDPGLRRAKREPLSAGASPEISGRPAR